MRIEEIESLMLAVINKLADRFPAQAVLKGGMELRLVDCPRYTNDLDYIFIPYSSKNEIKDIVSDALSEIPGCDVTFTLHSKCIRYLIIREHISIQVEINVAENCKSESLSTATLANKVQQLPRIVRVMSLDIALSHKLAAWNERDLIRDLYDASYMISTLHTLPDIETLNTRLASISYRNKGQLKKKQMSMTEFIAKLRLRLETLDQQGAETELRDYFAPEQLPGLASKIKTGIEPLFRFLGSQA